MYEDKTLVCKECGKEFVFTAGEQEFYAERGFQNEPQRCKACRDARKNAARGPREYFTATCAACGGEAKVPFEPKTDRPVYCSDCFAMMRELPMRRLPHFICPARYGLCIFCDFHRLFMIFLLKKTETWDILTM